MRRPDGQLQNRFYLESLDNLTQSQSPIPDVVKLQLVPRLPRPPKTPSLYAHPREQAHS